MSDWSVEVELAVMMEWMRSGETEEVGDNVTSVVDEDSAFGDMPGVKVKSRTGLKACMRAFTFIERSLSAEN